MSQQDDFIVFSLDLFTLYYQENVFTNITAPGQDITFFTGQFAWMFSFSSKERYI